MKKTPKSRKQVSAESIGKRAERGEDVSRYFTNAGRMMPPVQRVNVDFAQDMLNELDVAAREFNVSRASGHQDFRAAGTQSTLHGSKGQGRQKRGWASLIDLAFG